MDKNIPEKRFNTSTEGIKPQKEANSPQIEDNEAKTREPNSHSEVITEQSKVVGEKSPQKIIEELSEEIKDCIADDTVAGMCETMWMDKDIYKYEANILEGFRNNKKLVEIGKKIEQLPPKVYGQGTFLTNLIRKPMYELLMEKYKMDQETLDKMFDSIIGVAGAPNLKESQYVELAFGTYFNPGDNYSMGQANVPYIVREKIRYFLIKALQRANEEIRIRQFGE